MKKFTLFIALLAFMAINVMGQSISTEPALDNEKTTPTVTINKGENVVVKVTNPKPNIEYTLLLPGAPPSIIEQITSNSKGDSFSFKPLKFTKDETINYSVLSSDFSTSKSFNVEVGTILKKMTQ